MKGGRPRVLASACKALPAKASAKTLALTVEGVVGTPAIVLVHAPNGAPRAVTLAGEPVKEVQYSAENRLLWVRFANQSQPRELLLQF